MKLHFLTIISLIGIVAAFIGLSKIPHLLETLLIIGSAAYGYILIYDFLNKRERMNRNDMDNC